MKKIAHRLIALVMAMALALSMSSIAFAADVTTSEEAQKEAFYEAAVADAVRRAPAGTSLIYSNDSHFSGTTASVSITNTAFRPSAYVYAYVYDDNNETYLGTLYFNGTAYDNASAVNIVGNTDADVGFHVINAYKGTYTVNFRNLLQHDSTGAFALVMFFA